MKYYLVRISRTKFSSNPEGYANISLAGEYALFLARDDCPHDIFHCGGEDSPERINLPITLDACQNLEFSEDDKLVACHTREEAHDHIIHTFHVHATGVNADFNHEASYELRKSQE